MDTVVSTAILGSIDADTAAAGDTRRLAAARAGYKPFCISRLVSSERRGLREVYRQICTYQSG